MRKKGLYLGLAMLTVCFIAVSFTGNAYAISAQGVNENESMITLNHHIFQTNTSFQISETGIARVFVDYTGYEPKKDVVITVKISKKGFFIFWEDVITEVHTMSGEYYYNAYHYTLAETGTYRCTVTYSVAREDGGSDVITFEDIAVCSEVSHAEMTTETSVFPAQPVIPEKTSSETESHTETVQTTETTERMKPNIELLKREFVYDESGRYTMSVDYDEDGNKLREIDYDTDGSKIEEREYLIDGRLGKISVYEGSGYESVAYSYYESGKIATRTTNKSGSSSHVTTLYDEKGNVLRFRVDVINCNGNVTKTTYYDQFHRFSGYYTYAYDEWGRKLRDIRYDKNWQKVSYRDYIYDDYGIFVKSALYDGAGNLITVEWAD